MEIPILGDTSLYKMMAYFFIYGFLGWIVEVIYATIKTGKFVNRGFFNGPFCAIYGVGMAVLILLLKPLSDRWWLLFLVGIVFATALELITGFVLDKIFKTKWWDYSKEHFNLKGYVCLKFSLLWGIAVLACFYTVVPLFEKLVNLIPCFYWGISILGVLWIIFIADLVTVIIQLKSLNKNLKGIAKLLHTNSDVLGTGISKTTSKIKEGLVAVGGKIKKSRLGKAYPNLNKKHEEAIKQIEQAELEDAKKEEK